jgi:hypothetical protein
MSRRDSITNGELNDSQYYILASLVTPRHGYAVMKLLMNVLFMYGIKILILGKRMCPETEKKDQDNIYY